MNTNKIIQPRYDVTIYDGHAITMRTMTREQVQAINPQSVDHFLSSALGIWAFRTAEGEWIEHRGGDWPGLGDAGIRITQATQINYGDFLTPAEIADLTGYTTLSEGSALSARLLALRKCHRESHRPHFFLSRRAGGFGIAFNPERSWMWLERAAPAMGASE